MLSFRVNVSASEAPIQPDWYVKIAIVVSNFPNSAAVMIDAKESPMSEHSPYRIEEQLICLPKRCGSWTRS